VYSSDIGRSVVRSSPQTRSPTHSLTHSQSRRCTQSSVNSLRSVSAVSSSESVILPWHSVVSIERALINQSSYSVTQRRPGSDNQSV